jgi:hypothetical protein
MTVNVNASPRTRSTHLIGTVYATPKGFKLGSRGKVIHPCQLYGSVSKGDARRIRKAAYRAGLHGHAAAPRVLNDNS